MVDIVPTGSFQATLRRIGLTSVSFEGFPSKTFKKDFVVGEVIPYKIDITLICYDNSNSLW